MPNMLDFIESPDGEPDYNRDVHGNRQAQEGCDRCACGCKYWENDRCVACGAAFSLADREAAALEEQEARAWRESFRTAEEQHRAETAAREALYDAPVIGTPASTGVGSDSYPAVVVQTLLFQSGARKGKVKAIQVSPVLKYDPAAIIRSYETGGYGKDNRIDVTHSSVVLYPPVEYTRREKNGRVRWVRKGSSDWDSVALGEARDYRDPSF